MSQTTPSGAEILAVLRQDAEDAKAIREIVEHGAEVRAASRKSAKAIAAVAALIARNAELEAAIHRLIPHTRHADSCGDMDAYNNADVESCGCGLDSAIEFAAEALARTPAKGNDSCDSAT